MITVDRMLTAEEVRARLEADPVFLESAIVALYRLQTADEQATNQTTNQNGVGFNMVDAPFLSSVARQIQHPVGQRLSDRQHSVCLRLMRKYAVQITGLLRVATPTPTARGARRSSKPIKGYKADVYISGNRSHEWELTADNEAKALELMRKHITTLQAYRGGVTVTFGPLEAVSE